MKVFVSGQIGEKGRVRQAFAKLSEAGAQVTHDWTQTDDLSDKLAASDESGRRAAKDIDGIVDSDVYVLLSNNVNVGKGMYAELGAALALNQLRGRPDVYVVGRMNHLSIFYLHPAVRQRASLDDVIGEIQGARPVAA